MNLNTAFTELAAKHGSHSAAAIALGYTVEHYRAIRNGRVKVSLRAENFILLKAQEATLEESPPPGDPAAPGCAGTHSSAHPPENLGAAAALDALAGGKA